MRARGIARAALVVAPVANTILIERILTAGSFTDTSSAAMSSPLLVASGILLILVAVLVAIGATAGRRGALVAGLVWGLASMVGGLAFWLLNGDDSGKAIAVIGALASLLALRGRRALTPGPDERPFPPDVGAV